MTFVDRRIVLFSLLLASAAHAQVFDVHLHAPSSEKNAIAMKEAMTQLGVTNAVLIASESDLEKYRDWMKGTIPALPFPCETGKMPNAGIQCFAAGGELPDLDHLREAIKAGRVRIFGELMGQYAGWSPDDPRLEPYYALAEELDIPVGIHLGIGPPGVAYADRPGFPARKSPHYSGAAGSPLLLEKVLVRHPKLRLYAMHAAYPFLEDMLYMLYMHPQLYVDNSVLQYAIARPEYYRVLKTLVEAGYGKRIMYGSDGGSKQMIEGVNAIEQAPFLTSEQKRAILYDNAMTFFRIAPETGAAPLKTPGSP
jgi:hypothetical protein